MSKKFKATGSNKTTPLTKEQFDFIVDEFKDKKDLRMEVICHLMFRCIRIGDIVETVHDKKISPATIKVRDIYNDDGTLKDKITFNEEKTGKLKLVPIKGEKFVDALKTYWDVIKKNEYPMDETLFYMEKRRKPLRDSGVKFMLRKFVGKRAIKQCSPHSFRKAGARFMFEKGVRKEHISDVLNHHSTKVTEIYIDIVPTDIETAMDCFSKEC